MSASFRSRVFLIIGLMMAILIVQDDAPAQIISAGSGHSVVLNSSGKVVRWGFDDGMATTGLPKGTVLAVSDGNSHALAITLEGKVVGWGQSGSGRTTGGNGLSNVIAVSAGGTHSLALTSDGTVHGFGSNTYGQTVPALTSAPAAAISAGSDYSLSLSRTGEVTGWGGRSDSQSKVTGGSLLKNVVAISAGSTHSLALLNDGTVAGWGLSSNVDGGTHLTDIVAISAGQGHSLALKSDGTVIAWGDDSFAKVSGAASLTGVVAIDAGQDHSLAVLGTGKVAAWGRNNTSQLAVPTNLVVSPTATWVGQSWSDHRDGDFLGSYNWANGTPSTAASEAQFRLDDTYTVGFHTNAQAKAITVTDGNVTFDLTGHTYQTSGATSVSDGNLTIAGAKAQLSTGTLLVGTNAAGATTTPGTLTVGGGSTVTLGAGQSNVGTASTLTVDGGGTLLNNGTLTVSSGGSLNVNSGGVLGGSGTLVGNVMINGGAILAPGNSSGIYHQVGELELGQRGIVQIEIGNAGAPGDATTPDGTGSIIDLVVVDGTIKITATSADPLKVQLKSIVQSATGYVSGDAAAFDPGSSYSWLVFVADTITGWSDDVFDLDAVGFMNSLLGTNGTGDFFWSFSENQINGTYGGVGFKDADGIYLNYSPGKAPEDSDDPSDLPSSVATPEPPASLIAIIFIALSMGLIWLPKYFATRRPVTALPG